MTYINRLGVQSQCDQCRCHLPTNDRGYCQRCEEGWLDFVDLNNSSRELLVREKSLALCALTTADIKDDVRQLLKLEELLKKIDVALLTGD